jgi:hypothetical protein
VWTGQPLAYLWCRVEKDRAIAIWAPCSCHSSPPFALPCAVCWSALSGSITHAHIKSREKRYQMRRKSAPGVRFLLACFVSAARFAQSLGHCVKSGTTARPLRLLLQGFHTPFGHCQMTMR